MHMKLLINTDASWAPFVVRVLLGVVVFPHGAQKLFGWFGGFGFQGTMELFAEAFGLPTVVGLLVILLESVGAAALVVGLGTRIVALGFTGLAIGIAWVSHVEHGFFMNWFGNQKGEGIEYFLLWGGMALALVIAGGGKLSVDRWLLNKVKA